MHPTAPRGPQPHHPSYARDVVYGAVDGVVTTFAVVAGSAGGDLAPAVALILGVANLVADGFSMGISNFLGTHTENQERARLRRVEDRQIETNPDGELDELRRIFAAKGLSGDVLEEVVRVISSDRERWLRTMLVDGYGLALEQRLPWLAGITTFIAFVTAGVIPLLPFGARVVFVTADTTFTASAIATVLAFVCIGALRGRFAGTAWWRSALQTTAIGVVAAALAYTAGALLARVA